MFFRGPRRKSNAYDGNREGDRSFTRDDEVLEVQYKGQALSPICFND